MRQRTTTSLEPTKRSLILAIALPILATACNAQSPKAGSFANSKTETLDQTPTVPDKSPTGGENPYGSRGEEDRGPDSSPTGGDKAPDTGNTETIISDDDEGAVSPAPITGHPGGDKGLQEGQIVANGMYRIKSNYSKKCLIIQDQKRDPGSSVVQGDCNSASARFKIDYMMNGDYALTNLHSLRALQIRNQLAVSEAPLEIGSEYKAQNYQKWKIVSRNDGSYHVKPSLNQHYCIDVAHGSMDDNMFIQVWKECSAAGQVWLLELVD